MKALFINGGRKLAGTVKISGAKNAALPLLAAALLVDGRTTLRNLPLVADVRTMLQLLENLGARVALDEAAHSVEIDASGVLHTKAVYDIVRQMRASILVLGPLLSRFLHASVSLPGGCAIGARPIDLHLAAMRALGAKIQLEDGYVNASGALSGGEIVFDKITVGGTENALLAAARAAGPSRIINAASEPEIVNLCEFLSAFGCEICGAGTSKISITPPANPARNVDVAIIPDRIEAGTYLCAAAITGSALRLENACAEHLGAVMSKLSAMGVQMRAEPGAIEVLARSQPLVAASIQTAEYPGFPTDMQAQFMALATQAQGASVIDERLFENRFMHAAELARLGADIALNAHTATVYGPKALSGAAVMATDLRASSALVLAALVASGRTKISRIYHLERGYEDLCGKLAALGADIKIGEENDD